MSENQAEQDQQAVLVADAVDTLLIRFVQAGFAPATVLAGAHAAIVSNLATAFGGEVAAARCVNAAERVRSIPPASEMTALAAAIPAGRA